MTAAALPRSWYSRVFSAIKTQWIATGLLIPLMVLAYQTHSANEAAKIARAQAYNSDRLKDFQASGKALDISVSVYFTAISKSENVVSAQSAARDAAVRHAADVQSLLGVIGNDDLNGYMDRLRQLQSVIVNPPDISKTGSNITAFAKLIKSRNTLVANFLAKAA